MTEVQMIDPDVSLPGRAPAAYGHIYVLQYANGAAKIGITNDPARRVATHDTYAQIFERERTLCWVSPAHYWYQLHEFVLIAKALEGCKGQAIGEWFPGLNVSPVIAVAERLNYDVRSVCSPSGSLHGGTPPAGPLRRLPGAVRATLSARAQDVLRVGLSYPAGASPSLDDIRRSTWDRCGDAGTFLKSITELKKAGYYAERLLGFPAPHVKSKHRGVILRSFSVSPGNARRMLSAPLEKLAQQYVLARA